MLGRLNINSIQIKEIIICFLILFFIIIILIIIPIKIPFKEKILLYIISFNHKKIGKIYILLSLIMLIRGFIDAFMIRLNQILCFKHKGYLNPYHYCQIFTAHGVIMIFFVAMPLMIGIMNILIPLQIGSFETAFPNINLLSFWLTFFASLLINISLIIGEFAKTGWLAYPPLSEKLTSPWVGVDYWIWSLQISGISSLLSSINFIATIIKYRKKNLFFSKLSIFIWTCLCSNILILISFPILTIILFQLFLDRILNTHFYTSLYNGKQMLYINFVWAWGHPEVYILILPSFGIFSEIISINARKNIFSYNSLIYATISITILSFIVWLHHFFTMGSGYLPNIFFSISTMIISIPTGVKIFNWLFTILNSKIKFNPIFLWFLSFIIIFCIGGFAGIILSIPNLDFIFHNSLFLIAHFHSVIIGGVLFGYLAGIQYWFPLIIKRKINNTFLYINIILWFLGTIITFFPLYILGYYGMMRRVLIYYNIYWYYLLIISFIGSIFLFFAIITFFINIILSKKINIKNINYRNNEYLLNSKYYIDNIFYKKKFFLNNFYNIEHKTSFLPFFISLNIFIIAFVIIWWIWKLLYLIILLLFFNILYFIYE